MKRKRPEGKPMAAAHEQTSTLPENIIVDILFKLPARSLFRFRILSRKYSNLIQSTDFITANARDSCSNRAGVVVLAKSHSGKVASFLPPVIPNNSWEQVKNGFSDFPLPFLKGYGAWEPWLSYAGSFNGLVCLILHRWGEYWVLWNPATSQFGFAAPSILAQDDCFCNGESACRVTVGFGYDSEADDYKSVRVCWSKKDGGGVQVEVLSWVKRSWTEIQDELSDHHARTRELSRSSCHNQQWKSVLDEPSTGMVLCFKLHDEKLLWISTPNANAAASPSPSWSILRTINAWKGSLAMFVQPVQDSLLGVWLLDERDSSWSTSLTIHVQGSPCIPEAIWRVNGQSLFLLYVNCIACDSNGGRLKLPFDDIIRAFEFAQTLVRIPGS